MLNAIIIISFIFTVAGMGYYGIELLPVSILEQVNNLDGLRAVTAGSGALLGGLLGYIAKTMYERLESGVRQMPVDILFSRAVGLVLGL
ncbi:MAG: PIN/TRAM domain-containing protein, partial [Synechococcales cyanobacterium]